MAWCEKAITETCGHDVANCGYSIFSNSAATVIFFQEIFSEIIKSEKR